VGDHRARLSEDKGAGEEGDAGAPAASAGEGLLDEDMSVLLEYAQAGERSAADSAAADSRAPTDANRGGDDVDSIAVVPLAAGHKQQAAAPDGLSLRACKRLIRSALLAAHGRTIDGALANSIAESLSGKVEGVETRKEGRISGVDARTYLRLFGTPLAICLLVGMALGNVGFDARSSVSLSDWTDANARCGAESSSGDEDACTPTAQRSSLVFYLVLGIASGLCQV
jgi:hypothetical protein